MEVLSITPKTKVLQLIEAFPQLENLLIELVPAFEKLKNPVLRKTVARIATLQQAAAIGNIPAEKLINALRKAVGQESVDAIAEEGVTTVKPAWFNEDAVIAGFDIRAMLEAGEHPVNQVIAELMTLQPGDIYCLTTPFITAPLIDKAGSLQFKHWVHQVEEELFEIYFCR